MNRRDFIKDTAFASLVAGLGTGMATEIAAEPQAAGDKPPPPPVPCAIIGLGPQGREMLTSLAKQNNAPIMLCDTFKAPLFLKKAQALAPSAQMVQDYKQVLDNKAVQAVFIATPTHKHKQIVLDALAAGKHVYCEAPFSQDMAEARDIAKAGLDAKTFLMPGLQFRSNAQHKHVLKFMHGSALGTLVSGRSQWRNRSTWRSVWPTPEREAELNWRLDKNLSLGLVGEIGIHQVDTANWVSKTLPVAVTGFGGIMEYRDGRQVFDTVNAIFEYSKGFNFSYEASLSSSYDSPYELFVGTQSTIMVRDQRAWMFKEVDSDLLGWEVFARKDDLAIGDTVNGRGVKLATGIALVADATKQLSLGKDPGKVGTDVTKTALYQAVLAFFDAIRANKKPSVGPLEGYQATVAVIKANEAIQNRTRVVFQKEWFELT